QRIDTYSARGRAAVAAAGGADRDRALAIAAHHAKEIIGEKMAYAVGQGLLISAAVAHARGRTDDAAALLGQAIERLESTGMDLHAAVARRRLGELTGGDEGKRLCARADAWMTAGGIAD